MSVARREFLRNVAFDQVVLAVNRGASGLLAKRLCKDLNSDCNVRNIPNIIIILADDMDYGDVQAFNPKSEITTPNLNKLAEEGMVFTDAHTLSGICTPTR